MQLSADYSFDCLSLASDTSHHCLASALALYIVLAALFAWSSRVAWRAARRSAARAHPDAAPVLAPAPAKATSPATVLDGAPGCSKGQTGAEEAAAGGFCTRTAKSGAGDRPAETAATELHGVGAAVGWAVLVLPMLPASHLLVP